jgi:hypothetical protein
MPLLRLRIPTMLLGILILAFILRVLGIGYGLPLTTVADETPFTYGALQMIQSHTLIPALHPDLFASILPYPPYISYVLMPPFAAIIAIKYVLFHGTFTMFKATLLSNLSAFFIVARILNVLLGTLSVYFVYVITERLFHSRIASLSAAFLLATSLLHVALSMVGRDWVPISLIFLAQLMVLTHSWTLRKRYILTLIIAGVGMGISALSATSLIMIGLYYLCFDLRSWRAMTKDVIATLWGAACFVALAAIPYLLWHSGNGFLKNVTLWDVKNIFGLLLSPATALAQILNSEPVLVFAFLAGLVILCFRRKKAGYFIAAWTASYAIIFYVFFRLEPRFIVPLIPLFCIAGGYCVSSIWKPKIAPLALIVLLLPLIVSAQLSYLTVKNDTRQHVLVWAQQHFTADDKVLVSAGLRIPTQARAVEELRSIDPTVVRKIDEAQETLDRHDVPYVLNGLTDMSNSAFIADFPAYAKSHHYTYLIVEPDASMTIRNILPELIRGATVVEDFEGLGESKWSIIDSNFTGSFIGLFSGASIGPSVIVYKLADN